MHCGNEKVINLYSCTYDLTFHNLPNTGAIDEIEIP